MASRHNLIETLDSINKSTFDGDENSRAAATIAAKKLFQRLEAPWERMYEEVLVQPMRMMAVKIASDVKLWACLDSMPQTCAQLAQKTGTDKGFLQRILRVLVAMTYVEETDLDAYVETELSKTLKEPEGLSRGLDVYCMASLKQIEHGPEFFRRTGYKISEDMSQAACKWVMGMPEYEGGIWEMMDEIGWTPKFNSFLSGMRTSQPSWAPLWPVKEKLLDGWDGKSVLLVDVGGGKGRDLSNLAATIDETHPGARLVLQDRPSVLEEAKASGMHRQIETMPHDFFQPNPVHGARAYFEHAVVHDWPDKEARQILMQMKSGMLPGYGKILLMETIMPARAKNVDSKLACIDMQMGMNFCALERTEEQWKALLESVGLRYVGHQPVYGNTCMIEAELP
ncbi:hypothetical protein M409DRAFT_68194 [Zasmidium cellare ATCC 36951]|uniref:Uncharacterized protein n=1 Tax=Zasmidium cellare ATCC 36951 TaxID=1080233 RepID=A0A6A6CCP0_ZASCE|nr:uncharacterized protein M409DRAFT_68194 [Zasmidium cellare ATCC 36951]KAF2163948.1 hypothetical protein M409DRAFT_68194 [Zasmidium cellare ATCC 36951]